MPLSVCLHGVPLPVGGGLWVSPGTGDIGQLGPWTDELRVFSRLGPHMTSVTELHQHMDFFSISLLPLNGHFNTFIGHTLVTEHSDFYRLCFSVYDAGSDLRDR